MIKLVFLSLLLITSACNQKAKKSIYDPGNERQINDLEAGRVSTFCSAIAYNRKIATSKKINQQVSIKVSENTCDDSATYNTQSYTAVFDTDLSGGLYYQAAGTLCQNKIWTDKIEPLKAYCTQIAMGQRSDRIEKGLSLYVFEATKDDTYGTLINIREFAMNIANKSDLTFQRSHALHTYTKTKNDDYGLVLNYRLEERCTESDEIRICTQTNY